MIRHLTREAAGEPEGLLVFLHGRGADEHDLFPLFDIVDPERRLLGVSPRGPLSYPPGGAHWYRLAQVGYPDPETFHDTLPKLAQWLDGLGFPPDRTVIGGFSQGAVMSYALSLGEGRPRPAGLIGLSGFIPTVPGFELDLSSVPPAAIGHGTQDPIIPVEFSRQARAELEEAGGDVLYRESPMGHSIDPEFLGEIRAWLPDRLAVPR